MIEDEKKFFMQFNCNIIFYISQAILCKKNAFFGNAVFSIKSIIDSYHTIMSNKDFKVMKMEVEKWYVCDGSGNTTTLLGLERKTSCEIPSRNKAHDKIVTIEPKWKQEEPKNCFSPF